VYRFVDHTAELELRIEAADEAGVFAEALAAFSELVGRGRRGEELRREIAVEAADRPALLAAFLDELVFLAETEGLVPERLASLELGESGLRGVLEGRRGEPAHLVKGATLNNLAFVREGETWRARVVLDV
jgi:SHS2 domain-containing protein